MITNHILDDKRRVQRSLNEEAGDDPSKYIALVHEKAVEAQERYGIQLRYAEVEQPGSELESEELPEGATEHSLAAVGDKRRR